MSRFRDLLTSGERFVLSYELVPARASKGARIDAILEFAEQAGKFGVPDALNLTDNPGGGPALSPDVLGKEIKDLGVTPIVHFSARDVNRIGIESRALALDRVGVENLLVITGDYPTDGQMGLAKPVFDLDSVQLLDYLSRMNEGLRVEGQPERLALSEGTNFFLGCVVSPFKASEPEVMTQYYKLEKKVRAGADYVITQLGYDTRKYEELLQYMRDRGILIPVLGSVFVLSRAVARTMNRGAIPGCTVTDALLAQVEAEYRSPDRGKKASMERAARQIAVLRGLGYSGAHIEGFGLRFDDVRMIIERAQELEGNWQEYAEQFRFSPEGTFYLYEGKEDLPAHRSAIRTRRPPVSYWAMRVLHGLFFKLGTVGYHLMRRLSAWLDAHERALQVFYAIEHRTKAMLFDCRDCGDCVLPEMHYLCPESQCPKFQRVGPCGGSSAAMCEVFPERFCVWYRVYTRAETTGTLEDLRDYFVPPRDWTLYGTSSWINFYLGRDHTGKRMKKRRLPRALAVRKSLESVPAQDREASREKDYLMKDIARG
jgi:methylenetetrahydrofolate reductase (NADPH)